MRSSQNFPTQPWRYESLESLAYTCLIKELGTDLDQGPVLVTIEYTVIPERQAEFVETIYQYGRIRRRDGAYRWGIFRDTEAGDRYVEIFLVTSWAEHLRQHERETLADHVLEQHLRDCVTSEPKVHHLISANLIET